MHSAFKEAVNSYFLPFSFELKKIRFFKINFDLGVLEPATSETEDILNSFSP